MHHMHDMDSSKTIHLILGAAPTMHAMHAVDPVDNGYIWDQTRGARASDPPRPVIQVKQSALPLELRRVF